MKKQKNSKKAINMKKGKFLLIALCAIMLVQCCCTTTVSKAAASLTHTVYNGQVAVEFIDVASHSNGGKADATLIATKSGSSVVYTLVDCGTTESSTYLLQRLKTRGVTTIQNLILSHNHSDHVGGLEKLFKSNIKVKNIYMNERGGESVQKLIKQYRTTAGVSNVYTYANRLEKIVDINTGNQSSVKIKLYTSNNAFKYGTEISNLNENSLVVEVVGDNLSCLLLGDLRRYGLNSSNELIAGGLTKFHSTYADKLMNKNKTYTVVKLGHHGYRKSSKYDKGAVEVEAKYYINNFPAANYVFTATPSVFDNKEKLKAFTNTLTSKWTVYGWNKCWLHSTASTTNSDYKYSTQPIISFGNWSCMQ